MEKTIEAVFKGLGELAAQFQAHPWGAMLVVALVASVAVVVLGLKL